MKRRVPVYGLVMPADLDDAVRAKAAAEGRSIKDVLIELLWAGLEAQR